MKSLLCFISVFIFSPQSYSQAEIKTMFYNVLNFASAPPDDRLQSLNTILSSYEPDLFMVCEVESQKDASDILNYGFQYTSAKMKQSPFLFNTSGASLIHQVVYYDNEKFTLEATHQIKTNVRSINHYTFELKTNSKVKLEVFVAHFKASRGFSNENERTFEAQQFIDYISKFPPETNILLAGDFNMYSSAETAYQTLLNGTNALDLIDPIDSPGNWNSNSSYANIHTQSTRVSNSEFDDYGAGGGLDDRFDIILMSDAIDTKRNSIGYIDNSYKAWGNNGNCFNNAISNNDCAGLYSSQLREALYRTSDHLPVVAEFSIDEPFLTTKHSTDDNLLLFTQGNVIKHQLELELAPELKSRKVNIFNALGKEMYSFTILSENEQIDMSGVADGLYFLKVEGIHTPFKFLVVK